MGLVGLEEMIKNDFYRSQAKNTHCRRRGWGNHPVSLLARCLTWHSALTPSFFIPAGSFRQHTSFLSPIPSPASKSWFPKMEVNNCKHFQGHLADQPLVDNKEEAGDRITQGCCQDSKIAKGWSLWLTHSKNLMTESHHGDAPGSGLSDSHTLFRVLPETNKVQDTAIKQLIAL